MQTRISLALASAAVAALVVVPASAQSLGEVARLEAERRAKLREPAKTKVVTNDDLKSSLAPRATPAPKPVEKTGEAAKTPKTEPAANPEGAPATPADADAKKMGGADAPKIRDKRPEEHWRERAKVIRDRLEPLRASVNAMERRLESLRQALQSASPADAAGLNRELDEASKHLARYQAQLRLIEDEWTKFEDRARAEKIPLSWIQ